MTTKDFQNRGLLRIFLSYFKPHRRLFALDMTCAFLIAVVDLAFPLVSRTALYTWLPYERQDIRLQLPGALISTVGWIGCSYGFSIYFNYFGNYSYMYGSLTAVVILMLWLYACICILFFGAEINQHWRR